MCQKDLTWKLGLLGKIGASWKNECVKGNTRVKTVICEKSVCLRDFEQIRHFEKKMELLGKTSVRRDTLVKIGLLR